MLWQFDEHFCVQSMAVVHLAAARCWHKCSGTLNAPSQLPQSAQRRARLGVPTCLIEGERKPMAGRDWAKPLIGFAGACCYIDRLFGLPAKSGDREIAQGVRPLAKVLLYASHQPDIGYAEGQDHCGILPHLSSSRRRKLGKGGHLQSVVRIRGSLPAGANFGK